MVVKNRSLKARDALGTTGCRLAGSIPHLISRNTTSQRAIPLHVAFSGWLVPRAEFEEEMGAVALCPTTVSSEYGGRSCGRYSYRNGEPALHKSTQVSSGCCVYIVHGIFRTKRERSPRNPEPSSCNRETELQVKVGHWYHTVPK